MDDCLSRDDDLFNQVSLTFLDVRGQREGRQDDVKDDSSSSLDDQEDWSRKRKPYVEQDGGVSDVIGTDTRQYHTTPDKVPDSQGVGEQKQASKDD